MDGLHQNVHAQGIRFTAEVTGRMAVFGIQHFAAGVVFAAAAAEILPQVKLA